MNVAPLWCFDGVTKCTEFLGAMTVLVWLRQAEVVTTHEILNRCQSMDLIYKAAKHNHEFSDYRPIGCSATDPPSKSVNKKE